MNIPLNTALTVFYEMCCLLLLGQFSKLSQYPYIDFISIMAPKVLCKEYKMLLVIKWREHMNSIFEKFLRFSS